MTVQPAEMLTPPQAPAPKSGRNPLAGVNQKTLMWGGAAVVAIVALVAGTKKTDTSSSDSNPEAGFTVDTSSTDLYNDLQPELESIHDAILDMNKAPTPTTPTPGKPTTPAPSPKPKAGSGAGHKTYRVVKGDTLAKIAKKFKVSRERLYKKNKGVIEAAAKAHGRRGSAHGKHLFAGTVLVIP